MKKETFAIEYHDDMAMIVMESGLVHTVIQPWTDRKIELAKKRIQKFYNYPVRFIESAVYSKNSL